MGKVMAAPVSATKSITEYFQENFIPYQEPEDKNVIILAGGPGFGKSTLAAKLSEGFPVIRESARIIIDQDKANGIEQPQIRLGFDERVFTLQQQQENDAITELKTGKCFVKAAFSDRALDVAVYAYRATKKVSSDIKNKIQKALSKDTGHYFPFVFLVQPLSRKDYVQDGSRIETYEEALEIHKNIMEGYLALGFTVIPVPKDTVENRISFIRKHVLRTN
jgi:predicted ATPase